MGYKFYSFRDRSQQNVAQWSERTVAGEIKSCNTRSLIEIFNHYIDQKNVRILEAGCGLGGWVHYFYKRGYDIVGVEYESDIVHRVKEFDQLLPIVQGDVNHLKFPDNSFDVYISLGVIEHFEEGTQKAISEARRVLKPGGLAFITVPYLNFFRRMVVHPLRNLYFGYRRAKGEGDYFWEYRYTKRELAQFLESGGFELVYTGIDDYIPEDRTHHIGLYADFFFLRKKNGEIWGLNFMGRIILFLTRLFSPWLVCSGLHMVARNMK